MKVLMQNAVQLTIAINAAAALMAGIIIYIIGRKKLPNKILSILNLLFCVWSLFLYLALKQVSADLSAYYYRISFIPLIFLTPLFLHLLSVHSDKKVFTKNIITKLYVVFFLIFAAYFVMPDKFIKGASAGEYFRHVMIPALGFHIFVAIFLCFLSCGVYYLLYSDKMYLKLKQNRRIWLFLALIFGMLAPITVFLATYGIKFMPIGLLGVMPFIILSWYAVAAYRTLEADIVINKTVLLAYFTFFIILLYAGLVHFLAQTGHVEYYTSSMFAGCIVLLCLLFGMHYGGLSSLNRLAERIIYEKRMKCYRFLTMIHSSEKSGTGLDLLLNKGVDALVNLIGIECVSVYLLDEDTMDYKLRACHGIDSEKPAFVKRIPASSKLVEFLKENDIFVDGENEEFSSSKKAGAASEEFRKMNMKLSVPVYYATPIYSRKGLFGFLNLGNKKDNAPFTSEDMDILNAYSKQLGICMDNFCLMMSAIQDDLTKLYRRNYFLKRLEEETDRGKRYERPFSLMMLDVDNFKRINDTRGHQAGDEVLKNIARIIRSGLRKTDIASRYGGEEFIILLPETNNAQAALAAERLRKSVEEEFKGDITVSIGLATYDKSSAYVDIVREADVALYKAKKEGKNRVVSGQ